MARVAFVTGANGIAGGAIAEYLAQKTTVNDFKKIIVSSRNPPALSLEDPRVSFVSLDFFEETDGLAMKMREFCFEVTHAFFASYVHKDDFAELATANKGLFNNFLSALEASTANLQNITLITGGKYYNVHRRPCPYPADESDPRLVAPSENFYYIQEDELAARQFGKRWSWNVIRPVGIIGALKKPNGMNHALTLALYFLICREEGKPALMPTNVHHWNGVEDYSYAPLIADLAVFAATNRHCANEAFNVDNGDVFCWRHMWPRLAAYFGADGTKQTFSLPQPAYGEGFHQEFKLVEWAQDQRAIWDRLCERRGMPQAKRTFDYATWAMQDWPFRRTWCATVSINKARKFGWHGHIDTYDCLVETFKRLQLFELIP